MLKIFFKKLLRRIFSRTTSIKFYYSSEKRAKNVFNCLSRLFLLNKEKYLVLKSRLIDDYWKSGSYIVFFKFIEAEQRNSPSIENLIAKISLEAKELYSEKDNSR